MAKLFTGVVVSANKNMNTIVVTVVSQHVNPIYKKILKKNKKYKVHAESGDINIGDTVVFCETRPLSRDVKYKLIKKITK